MKDLLEFIAKSMVSDPDAVIVKETVNGDNVTLELHVGENDMGKVIGKQGRIAKAIRTVMRSASAKANQRISVEID